MSSEYSDAHVGLYITGLLRCGETYLDLSVNPYPGNGGGEMTLCRAVSAENRIVSNGQ